MRLLPAIGCGLECVHLYFSGSGGLTKQDHGRAGKVKTISAICSGSRSRTCSPKVHCFDPASPRSSELPNGILAVRPPPLHHRRPSPLPQKYRRMGRTAGSPSVIGFRRDGRWRFREGSHSQRHAFRDENMLRLFEGVLVFWRSRGCCVSIDPDLIDPAYTVPAPGHPVKAPPEPTSSS